MMPSKLPATNLMPILALLLGASFWGLIWYPLRLLEQQGLSGLWSTLIVYGTATMIGLVVLAVLRPSIGHFRLLLLLALASGWCNVAFILALLEGQVVRVMLLFFLAPLWTVLLGKLLLRESLSPNARMTLLLAMSGALIMLWDRELGAPWPRSAADWMAISAGFAFALTNVTIRRLQKISVWLKTVVAWGGVVALAVLWLMFSGLAPPAAGPVAFGGAVALGSLGMVLMTVAVVYGVTHMPAHRAAVILLFELVVAAASAHWLTDEVVHPNEWAGGALVIMAAWFAARSQFRDAG